MTETADFTAGPLYKTLVTFFPTMVKNPFEAEPRLNVQKLRKATEKSHEAVYKWLRTSSLTPKNATLLVELANREANLTALSALGRTPPAIQDFSPFVFA